LNYTQGYSHSNSYKSGGSGGSRGAYVRGNGGRGNPSDRGGGRFANFQCQICLKYGHTANIYHFRSDMNFQPHESLTFFDPATLQPIPYSSSSTRSSNTWINPNSKFVALNHPINSVLCLQTRPLMAMVKLVQPGFQILELASM